MVLCTLPRQTPPRDRPISSAQDTNTRMYHTHTRGRVFSRSFVVVLLTAFFVVFVSFNELLRYHKQRGICVRPVGRPIRIASFVRRLQYYSVTGKSKIATVVDNEIILPTYRVALLLGRCTANFS